MDNVKKVERNETKKRRTLNIRGYRLTHKIRFKIALPL